MFNKKSIRSFLLCIPLFFAIKIIEKNQAKSNSKLEVSQSRNKYNRFKNVLLFLIFSLIIIYFAKFNKLKIREKIIAAILTLIGVKLLISHIIILILFFIKVVIKSFFVLCGVCAIRNMFCNAKNKLYSLFGFQENQNQIEVKN